ncbi:FHA domain-containing protein [Myxosarcina sp. GI1(2024)]
MDFQTILISAIVGIITSAITAYITTLLKIKEERKKWFRDFALKYAEKQASDLIVAQRMAEQFAIGVLIYENPTTAERERFFIPPNCRLTAGRSETNSISINDIFLSQRHCAFDADEKNVYVLDLGSPNGVFVSSSKSGRGYIRVSGKKYKLYTDDVVMLASTTKLRFHQLDKRR